VIIWYSPFPVIIEQPRRFPMHILLAVAVLGLSRFVYSLENRWQVPMTIGRCTIVGVAINFFLDQFSL
jgi:hypothetical protein